MYCIDFLSCSAKRDKVDKGQIWGKTLVTSKSKRIPPLVFVKSCSAVKAWDKFTLTVLVAKHQLSYCITFTVNVSELTGSSDYTNCETIINAAVVTEMKSASQRCWGSFDETLWQGKRSVTVVSTHCYLSLPWHMLIAPFIYVSSIPVTTSLSCYQRSSNSTDQQITSRSWKLSAGRRTTAP